MLDCSLAAADMIRRLLAVHDIEGADGGLRLSLSTTGRSLAMTIVGAPDPDDVVLEAHGSRMFLDSYALARTEGMVLDSDRGAQADVFVLLERAERDRQTSDRLRRYLDRRR